jgi:hypothetical protein
MSESLSLAMTACSDAPPSHARTMTSPVLSEACLPVELMIFQPCSGALAPISRRSASDSGRARRPSAMKSLPWSSSPSRAALLSAELAEAIGVGVSTEGVGAPIRRARAGDCVCGSGAGAVCAGGDFIATAGSLLIATAPKATANAETTIAATIKTPPRPGFRRPG